MKCLFKAFDTDQDGVLSRDELKRAWMMFMNKNEETAEESIKGDTPPWEEEEVRV